MKLIITTLKNLNEKIITESNLDVFMFITGISFLVLIATGGN
jgi:hypothetical protein